MTAKKLDDAALEAAFRPLAERGWVLTDTSDGISKTFRFKDFNQAFGWMVRIALVAEKMDHHPEWKNIYRTVEVVMSTHSAGGVSALDIEMAGRMDAFAEG